MNTNRQIILIADNIRSTYNVGSMFRTADAFAVKEIAFTGVCPTPKRKNETRLPHVVKKNEAAISKVALGAEEHVSFQYFPTTQNAIQHYKDNDFTVFAIEQSDNSVELNANQFSHTSPKVALVIGTETIGLDEEVLALCDKIFELPMLGKKESLNASVMTGIALFVVRM